MGTDAVMTDFRLDEAIDDFVVDEGPDYGYGVAPADAERLAVWQFYLVRLN